MKRTKQILATMLSIVVLLGLLAGCSQGGSSASGTVNSPAGSTSVPTGGEAADGKVVKIGVFEPQSGDNGAGGKQEMLGMQYANSITDRKSVV